MPQIAYEETPRTMSDLVRDLSVRTWRSHMSMEDIRALV